MGTTVGQGLSPTPTFLSVFSRALWGFEWLHDWNISAISFSSPASALQLIIRSYWGQGSCFTTPPRADMHLSPFPFSFVQFPGYTAVLETTGLNSLSPTHLSFVCLRLFGFRVSDPGEAKVRNLCTHGPEWHTFFFQLGRCRRHSCHLCTTPKTLRPPPFL